MDYEKRAEVLGLRFKKFPGPKLGPGFATGYWVDSHGRSFGNNLKNAVRLAQRSTTIRRSPK